MKSALRNPFVWAFVVGCAVVTLMRPLLRREPPPPPVLRQLPRFELVGSNGKPFGSDELRGHVYVVNFFFTETSLSEYSNVRVLFSPEWSSVAT